MENAYCLEINDILLSPPARAYKRMMIGPEENVFDYVTYLERELAAP